MSSRDILYSSIKSLSDKNFTGKIYENNYDLDITITYKPNMMSINGLKPELPPFIMFEGDVIVAGESNDTYEKVSNDEGLQYLKAFDPRIFGNENNLKIVEIQENEFSWEFTLEYDFAKIIPDLPHAFIEWLQENGENPRNVHFVITKKDEKLQLMTHKDISTQNLLKIKFTY